MNDDLISRSALLADLQEYLNQEVQEDMSFTDTGEGIDLAMERVKDAPAVDAEPVRHGRWIEVVTYDQDGDCLEVEYKCSECGRLEGLDDEPYCNCGAKMDAEVEG